MARKKRIAIIMGRIYKNINKKLLCGMIEQANVLGYSVFIFTLNEECFNERITYGEKNLFNALNFDQVDGVIYAPYTFDSQNFCEYIEKYLLDNCTKPVIRIGIETDRFIPIWYDDRREIAEITFHLIYGHGCKKLLCLTGPDTLMVAQSRAMGFMDAMQKAGLEHSEGNIIFGDFWIYAAQTLASEIADHVREKPEAIVCTNDTMAIALCDALTERGYSVPDDIRVTGYDGITETRMHVPPVTTYRTSHKMLGRRAMCVLYQQMTGNKAEPVKSDKGVLFCRESCGCNSYNEKFDNKEFDQRISEERIMDCTVSAAFHDAVTLDGLVNQMFSMLYKFMDSSRFDTNRLFLCLCSDWDSMKYTESGIEYRRTGYSDTMYLIGSDQSRCNFRLTEILPESLDTSGFSATFFLPVHFQDQCYGYIALDTQENIDDFNMEYIRYCREVNNALKYLCTQNELKRLHYRQAVSTSRDELTGLFIFETCRYMWSDIRNASIGDRGQLYMVVVTAGGL